MMVANLFVLTVLWKSEAGTSFGKSEAATRDAACFGTSKGVPVCDTGPVGLCLWLLCSVLAVDTSTFEILMATSAARQSCL